MSIGEESNRPFDWVETAAPALVETWTTIAEHWSICTRRHAFEATPHDKLLPEIEREVMPGEVR